MDRNDAMITIYAAHKFPPFLKGLVRDMRVTWALEELGLPYQCHWMDTSKAEHTIDPNRSINPFGKMPSLTDGDVNLFESGAIVHYLYDKAGKLPKDAEARAKLLQWSLAAINTIEPPFIDIFRWDMFWEGRPGREVRYNELIEVAQTRSAELERALGTKPFLLGEEFSPADILMTTVLNFAGHQPLALEKAPGIRAYAERCKARPAYRRAFAQHGAGPKAD
jgi:glutathione S-transferase